MYLNKTPSELTVHEILNSFRITGVLRGYTQFDTELFETVIDKYDIHNVYDSCAGWGERFLCCVDKGVDYTGLDINDALFDCYGRLMNDYGDVAGEHYLGIGDGASCRDIDSRAEAVITCPPYGSTEIYSDMGAENLSDDKFFEWWDSLVRNIRDNSNVKYFCFQINQKYKNAMRNIVESNGYVFLEEFVYKHNRSSHFTRKNGVDLNHIFGKIHLLLSEAKAGDECHIFY